MFTLFKVLEVHGNGFSPAMKALEKRIGRKHSMSPIRKTVTAGLILVAVAGGIMGMRWARKKMKSPKVDLKKKQEELQTMLNNILQETIDDNINPKLHQLKDLFKAHWDDLMDKKQNYFFWREWLVGLTTKETDPSDEINNWNHGRKEKMKADLGSVKF
jgi:hypothetical protein